MGPGNVRLTDDRPEALKYRRADEVACLTLLFGAKQTVVMKVNTATQSLSTIGRSSATSHGGSRQETGLAAAIVFFVLGPRRT